jgi:hypothetical protein
MNRSSASLSALTTATFLAAIVSYSATASAQLLGSLGLQTDIPPLIFNVTITDQDGAPVEGATVLNSDTPATLTTDHEGQVTVPQTWFARESVTIEAPGFVRATYLDLSPGVATLKIRRQPPVVATRAARFELDGDSSGFGALKNDGVFDIGLIVQAVPRAQLSMLNLQSLISPEVDHFTVLGQAIDLPSNITIPDQTENYIFPLHFNKPKYRLFLPTPGDWQIAALHARVPFKATIDALQNGKSIIDIVNTFDFTEGSVTPVTLSGSVQSQDLLVNGEPFTKSITFTAPAYDRSMKLLTISLANLNGAYYPTDLKNVPANSSVQLTAPAGAQATGMVLAVFKKATTKSYGPEVDQYSAVILPNSETRPFDPIRLVEPPHIIQNQLVLDTPVAGPDLNPIMTYASLSIVTLVAQGKLQMETKENLWDVWSPNWVNKLDLPIQSLPKIDPASQSLRWEVGFSAQFVGQKSIPPGPDALEKITHVSRSAVDL